MGFNRIADREFDARNPRTAAAGDSAGRADPDPGMAVGGRGRSPVPRRGRHCSIRSASLLAPVALVWMMAYSFTKRFTWWPHLWLGLCLAIAPVGGYLAVTGRWSEPWWVLVAITVAVADLGGRVRHLLRVARRATSIGSEGLRSAVVRLGERGASCSPSCCTASRFPRWRCSAGAPDSVSGTSSGRGVAAAILAYEHQLVKPGDLSRLDAAFFTMNGVMSVTVFGFALMDRVVEARRRTETVRR